jgi:hypothetical protein
MKVWIVTGDFGSWESHHRRNLKLFDSLEKAIKFKEEFELNPDLQIAKDLYHKFVYGGEEDANGILVPRFSVEEQIIWQNRSLEFNEFAQFNECILEEFELE